MIRRCIWLGAIIGFLPAAAQRPSTPTALLTFVRAIELPGVEGRIDHLAFDPTTRRLFVAALGNNSVEVLDASAGTHLRSLEAFHEPQGIAVVAGGKSIVVAEGQGAGAQFVETTDLRRGTSVALGDDSDNVRYDPAAKRVYVGYGGGSLAAIDPADGRIVGRVPVGGHPESFQLESTGSRIYVNVPTARRIVVVDRATLKVVTSWPVISASANYPMALDEEGHRLFVGCRSPSRLLVYDTQTGQETASIDIVGDTDDLFYDAARRRVYVVGGQGFIDVLDASGTKPLRAARLEGSPGARTALFVAAESRLYLAVPHRGAQRAEVRVFQAAAVAPGPRPPTVLFMCPHGAAKSVLASAYFQRIARERGLNVRVITAGTDPDAQVSPAVSAHLTSSGYDLPIATPRKVTAEEFETADVVVSLGCDLKDLPAPRGTLMRWDEVPGPGEDFARADAAIRKRVLALIEELAAKPGGR